MIKKDGDYYRFKRSEIVAFLPKKYTNVLEIGCGTGIFRHNLEQRCQYWGIEIDPDSANIAESNLDKVIVSTYEDVYDNLPDGYFDLVICNDVIEHMPDHDFFFKSIKKKLVPNSYIVGSIPNVRYIRNIIGILIKKDWKYKSQGVLDYTHLRFFTKKSLKRVFTEHNFTVEKIQGINCIWNKRQLLKKIPTFILFILFVLVLGQDVKFKQFGFRIKLS